MQNAEKQLGARLRSALPYLTPGGRLADIGTDHAYLPIEAVRAGISRQALACDVRRGPLARAEANVRAAGLSDRIGLLLTDGLHGVERFCPDDVLVFGMGGELIVRILSEAPWLRSASVGLILQPMTRAGSLRSWLLASGFSIRGESLTYEDQYYQTIYARYGGAREEPYAPEELELGRYILSGGSPLLAGYLGQKLAQLQAVMEGKRRGSADTAAEETLAGALHRRLRQIREEQE